MRKQLALSVLVCALGLPSGALAKPAAGSGVVAANKAGKKAKSKEKAPCYAPEVHVVRLRGSEVEHRHLSLTMCDGSVNPAALDSVSVLARPRNTDRPSLAEIKAYQRLPVGKSAKAKRRIPGYLAPQVMRVHPGLLERLQRVARRWPGKTIEIISGHRPDARFTSRHHHGRALDMRVDGVSREALRDFLRSFDATGVGYYPNSYFVHMDVREDRGYWVDRSGPGEPADYGRWPPPKQEIDHASAKVVRGALADLEELRNAFVLPPANPTASAAAIGASPTQVGALDDMRDVKSGRRVERKSPRQAAVLEPEAEGEDELSAEAVEQIKKQALDAIRGL